MESLGGRPAMRIHAAAAGLAADRSLQRAASAGLMGVPERMEQEMPAAAAALLAMGLAAMAATELLFSRGFNKPWSLKP